MTELHTNNPEEVQTAPSPTIQDTEPTKQAKKRPRKDAKNGGVGSTILVILSALVMAVLLITYVFHSYQVDGVSMDPSLKNGDRLIVWKVPRTIARITGNPYIPNRGDVVVFTESGLSSCGQSQDTKQLIKRVVGLPGERVVVKDGVLTVFNDENPNGFSPDTTLPYGDAIDTTNNDVDTRVGTGQLFVAGDNRDESCDSRIFGPIQADQIVGKLVLRVLPINNITKF